MKNPLPYLLLALLLFAFGACDFSSEPAEEDLIIEALDYELDTIEKQAVNDSGQVFLSLSVLDFVITGPQDDRLKGLQEKIRRRLIANNINFDGRFDQYTAIHDSLEQEYLRLLKGDYPPVEAWNIGQSLEVMYNEKGLFCLLSKHDSYSGGAHSNSFVDAQVYRLNDTTLLPLDSLLQPNSQQELIALGEAFFRINYGLDETQSFEEAGYWFEDNRFELPETYWLDTAGLHFHYNENEIAPYLRGDFYLSLPFDNLQSILKAPYLLNSVPEEQDLES